MFQPTHLLVSRSRQTPVQLVSSPQGYVLYTEQEWTRSSKPAFELRPRLGLFCQGVSVVGYHLQPLPTKAVKENPNTTTACS